MGFTKLTSMALIKNENNAFIFQCFHFIQIPGFAYSSIQFLNGGNNEFVITSKLFN